MARYSLVLRACFGYASLLLTAVLVLQAEAQQVDKKTDPKKSASSKETNTDLELVEQIYKHLMETFQRQDINRNGYLEKSEVINMLGLARGPAFVKDLDSDGDGKISKEEFEAWAQGEADRQAKYIDEQNRLLEKQIQEYQAALAKATAEAKERYQRAIERARQQQRQNRNRRTINLNRR